MTWPVPRVYLDANVFIIAYETQGAAAMDAFTLLTAVEAGTIHGVSSELTLAEILPGPLNAGASELVDAYHKIMTAGPNLTIVPVTRDILVVSAELRTGRAGLKLQDAVHCASARHAGCTHFVSDDRRIPRGLGFDVLSFGPNMLVSILG
jgi:predicted nucleic acid-binding protein